MMIKKVKPMTIAEPTRVSDSKSPDTESVTVTVESLVDEKYCAENHIPVWTSETAPAVPYVQDESHNLATPYDINMDAR